MFGLRICAGQALLIFLYLVKIKTARMRRADLKYENEQIRILLFFIEKH